MKNPAFSFYLLRSNNNIFERIIWDVVVLQNILLINWDVVVLQNKLVGRVKSFCFILSLWYLVIWLLFYKYICITWLYDLGDKTTTLYDSPLFYYIAKCSIKHVLLFYLYAVLYTYRVVFL